MVGCFYETEEESPRPLIIVLEYSFIKCANKYWCAEITNQYSLAKLVGFQRVRNAQPKDEWWLWWNHCNKGKWSAQVMCTKILQFVITMMMTMILTRWCWCRWWCGRSASSQSHIHSSSPTWRSWWWYCHPDTGSLPHWSWSVQDDSTCPSCTCCSTWVWIPYCWCSRPISTASRLPISRYSCKQIRSVEFWNQLAFNEY